MAILLSSGIKPIFVNSIVARKMSNGSAITLYSGAKPTAAAYQTNFNSSYSNASSNFIWHGTGQTSWARSNNSLYAATPPTPTVPTRNGTVTWGVIWGQALTFSGMASAPSIMTQYSFFIVDVSSYVDATGVIQLANTTLSTTDQPLTILSAVVTFS